MNGYNRLAVNLDHLSIDVIETEEQLDKIGDQWNSLFNSVENTTVFQSYPWNKASWSHAGKGYKTFIVIVRENGALVGVGPFMLKKRFGCPEIEPIGSGQGAYFGVLCKNERKDIIQAIASKINDRYHKGILHIPYYVSGNVGIDVLLAYLKAYGWKDSRWIRTISHNIHNNNGFEDYWKCKSKKVRHNLRREHDKFENIGNVTIIHYKPSELTQSVLYDMAAIQKKSWLSRRGVEEINSTFYSNLIQHLARQNMAEVYCLNLNGESIAFLLNFFAKGHDCFIIVGFHEGYEKYSPGKYLWYHCIKNMFDRGDRNCDFLFEDAEYKRFWSNRTYHVYRGVCFRGTLGWFLSWYPHRIHGMLAKHNFLRERLSQFRSLKRKIFHRTR